MPIAKSGLARALIERRDPQPDRYSIDDLLFQVTWDACPQYAGSAASWPPTPPIEYEPLPEDLREGLIGLTLREWLRGRPSLGTAGHAGRTVRALGNLNPYAVIASDPHGASPIAPLTLMRIASGVAPWYRYESGREPWARGDPGRYGRGTRIAA
jgi:hypothetical protein